MVCVIFDWCDAQKVMHDTCFALNDLLGFDRFTLLIPGTCSNSFKGHILTSTVSVYEL